MKFKKIIVILLILPLFAFTMHKYYVSLCEIEFIKEKQSIQITLGVFIEDLEVTLNKNSGKQLNLASKTEVGNIDDYYKKYLNEHLQISVNGKNQPYKFIGKEYDGDIVRFYLEITDIKELKSVEIFNNILTDDFSDQKNIVKLKVNDFNKTFYLNKSNHKSLLKF
ncbi:MAG: peptidase E [Lutibacter sp.]|nr:peptidase E [Lutibacter sp.]